MIAGLVGVLLFLGLGRARAGGDTFEIVVYNVENLFDVDGEALFDDYRPPGYTPVHLAAKLDGITRVLKRYGAGQGPDVILFVELEADQTAPTGPQPLVIPPSWSGTTAQQLLRSGPLSAESRDASAAAWLFKQIQDEGLGPYHVAIGDYEPALSREIGDIAHVNAVFSRFPITASQTHQTVGARGILEATLDVHGHPLHVFVNHWKSGASNPDTEPLRIGNARVLRARLDALLREDPRADIVIGGDFNSQYNQKARYPQMRVTAMDDILRSQGDELALREGRADLYNLWFELPPEQRGSDVWRQAWGTLMHILITPGLHDYRGIQYVDNSFAVGRFPGLNADPATGRPLRWYFADGGGGFSDHFPVSARFRVVGQTEAPAEWMPLENPSRTAVGPAEPVPVRLSLDAVPRLADWPEGEAFPRGDLIGRFFEVSGKVKRLRPFLIEIDGPGGEFGVWIHDRDARERFFGRYRPGQRIRFIGELGQYRGRWQFVVPEALVGPLETGRN